MGDFHKSQIGIGAGLALVGLDLHIDYGADHNLGMLGERFIKRGGGLAVFQIDSEERPGPPWSSCLPFGYGLDGLEPDLSRWRWLLRDEVFQSCLVLVAGREFKTLKEAKDFARSFAACLIVIGSSRPGV